MTVAPFPTAPPVGGSGELPPGPSGRQKRGDPGSRSVADSTGSLVFEEPFDAPADAVGQRGDVVDRCVTTLDREGAHECGHPEQRAHVPHRRLQQAAQPPELPQRGADPQHAVQLDDDAEPSGGHHAILCLSWSA